MKTVEEFIKEIESSEALKNELKAIKDKDALADFLKRNDVDGTVNDFGKAIEAMNDAEGEIDDDDVEAVAGGTAIGSYDRYKYWGDIQTQNYQTFHSEAQEAVSIGKGR